jgi:hypothetical protein
LTALPLLFWLALLLPGFAIARRVVPRELESGPLPSIAVAWTAALSALVLPIALFYILGSVSPATRVPIGALAIATACFIAWGAVDVAFHLAAHIARTRTWDAVGRALIPFLSIAGAVILADVVLADRHGAQRDRVGHRVRAGRERRVGRGFRVVQLRQRVQLGRQRVRRDARGGEGSERGQTA